jgi:ABC-type molybdate transport system substrate-binding protein
MPSYKVNRDAVKHARQLIDRGDYDDITSWSDAAPSAAESNKEIDKDSYEEFARWHLAIDPDASDGTKGRVAFPYGDFKKVNRAALIHAKQRASQNDHAEIEKAADELLQHLDAKRA